MAEAASLKGDFFAVHLKMFMESKQLGSAGILATGKQPDPSGEFEVSRLDAFELLVCFQIIVQFLAASVRIYTVHRGLLE